MFFQTLYPYSKHFGIKKPPHFSAVEVWALLDVSKQSAGATATQEIKLWRRGEKQHSSIFILLILPSKYGNGSMLNYTAVLKCIGLDVFSGHECNRGFLFKCVTLKVFG